MIAEFARRRFLDVELGVWRVPRRSNRPTWTCQYCQWPVTSDLVCSGAPRRNHKAEADQHFQLSPSQLLLSPLVQSVPLKKRSLILKEHRVAISSFPFRGFFCFSSGTVFSQALSYFSRRGSWRRTSTSFERPVHSVFIGSFWRSVETSRENHSRLRPLQERSLLEKESRP